MSSRIHLARFAVWCIVALLVHAGSAVAREGYWRGTVSNDWNTASNWFVVGAPGDGSFVPEAGGGFNVRAVIGTDNPNGALNSNDAPFGSPVISGPLPGGKATIGGLALGVRDFDFDDNCPGLDFCNPDPAPGALVGALTITGGTLNNVSTADAAIGADGRILVGVQGRGYLTMTGGTLTGLQMVVAGEQITTGAGVSTVDLNGNSTVTISNGVQATATFGRRLIVTGPNVDFSASGNITLQGTNTYIANITSATAHSPLRTSANVNLGGNLELNYNAPTPATIGQTWNLFDFAGGATGSFANVGSGGEVTVNNAPPTAPGEVFRLRQTTGGTQGNLLQLVYDSVLVLQVNRNTGEMFITNPVNHKVIGLDGYQITSPTAGSLVSSFHGISDAAQPPDSGWVKPPLSQLTPNFLAEVKPTDPVLNRPIGSSLPLGVGFDQFAVGQDPANFGVHPEDLVFHYTFPGAPGGWVRGEVEYVGDMFDNNLVLRVNPATGVAELQNDTLHDLSFDGYTILSSTGALSDANWIGIGGDWQKSPGSESSLTETNLFGDLTLAAGDSVAIGQIGNFTSVEDREGLTVQFIRTNIPGGDPEGDFNGDGIVDAADYTVWRDTDGSPEGFALWKENFGASDSIVDEEFFRVGVVRFDSGVGAGAGGAGSLAAVPEPGSGLLMLVGLGAVAALGCHRSRRARPHSDRDPGIRKASCQRGGAAMSGRLVFRFSAVASVGAALLVALPAAAQTQEIPLENWDFNEPGGGKVVPFDANGNFVPGLIPGWTFEGPGMETAFNPVDGTTGEPFIIGDSSTEPSGSTLSTNPGNHLTLSALDGKVFQTSSFNIVNIPSTQAYRLSFDATDFFTISEVVGGSFDEQFTGRGQFQASIYYKDTGGNRASLDTLEVNPEGGGWFRYALEVPGGTLPGAAIGRPIGVEFDVTSLEFNQGTEFDVAHSWIGFDDVLLEIAGILPGDLNGDGVVNQNDYAIVRDNQQQPCLAAACGALTRGALASDGVVTLNDFRAFKTLFAASGAGSAVGDAATSVPEPSSLVLVILMAAALSGSFVRRRRTMLQRIRRPMLLAAISFGALLAPVSTATAELLYYDPFLIGTNPNAGEYIAWSEVQFVHLAGQNPVMNFPGGGSVPNFFSGPWETPSDAQSGGIVHPNSISYLGTPSLGGSARVAPVPDPQDPDAFLTFDGRTGRHLNETWTSSTATFEFQQVGDEMVRVPLPGFPEGAYYISFLANFGTTTGGMGYRSVEFWPDGNVVGQDAGRMDIGYNQWGPGGAAQQNPNTARMAINVSGPGGGQQILAGSPPSYNEDGLTHLIVFKFELNEEDQSDFISVYLNPTTPELPEVADALFTNVNFTLTAMGHMSHFGGGTTGIFDELRVGTTFASVLPELPCAGGTRGQVLPACDPGIDLVDFNTILENMGRTDAAGPHEGDVAGAGGGIGNDGRVDLRDFRLWKDNRTGVPGVGSAIGSVPEPSSLFLALATTLAAAAYRYRRR